MLQAVKEAFGGFMGQYFAGVVPTTTPLREYVLRPPEKAIMWASARMVDAAEEMLASYLRNDNEGGPTRPAHLPILLCAMAKDYTQTMRDYSTQVADALTVVFPQDERERGFKLRTVVADIRTQIAVIAHDVETAKSLVGQFSLFLDSPVNRRFAARYVFNSMESYWPVQIENPDVVAMSIATDAKNLTILALDLTLKATIPLFAAPGPDEFKDNKGGPATDDVGGFGGVAEVRANSEIVARVDE